MSSRNNLASFILCGALAGFVTGCAGGAAGDTGRAVNNTAAPSNGSGAESARQPASMDAANNSNTPAAGAPATASDSAGKKNAGGAQAPMPTPQVGSGGNDFFIFTKARAAIDADAELRGSGIIVNVKNGVVILNGNVAGETQKGRAEQLARGIEGIANVRNELRVSKTAGPR